MNILSIIQRRPHPNGYCVYAISIEIFSMRKGTIFYFTKTNPNWKNTQKTDPDREKRVKNQPGLEKTREKWVLVMGSAAHGICKDIKPSLNQLVAIPKIGSGESLNVGVSMGILLHHLTK